MSTIDRRQFVAGTAAAATAATLPYASRAYASMAASEPGPFKLMPLPYAVDALEPWIDAETMAIHHGKHHAAYVRNLNKALKDHGEVAKLGLTKMLQELNSLPESIRTAVRNLGGGDYNHTLFWNSMGPQKGGAESVPGTTLQVAIDRDLGGLDKLKENFDTIGAGVFGSGYAFLVTDANGVLEIMPKPNQDCPLTDGKIPLMTNDVWEHAYYLKYQNRRGDYLKAWWNVVDWQAVSDRYAMAIAA